MDNKILLLAKNIFLTIIIFSLFQKGNVNIDFSIPSWTYRILGKDEQELLRELCRNQQFNIFFKKEKPLLCRINKSYWSYMLTYIHNSATMKLLFDQGPSLVGYPLHQGILQGTLSQTYPLTLCVIRAANHKLIPSGKLCCTFCVIGISV